MRVMSGGLEGDVFIGRKAEVRATYVEKRGEGKEEWWVGIKRGEEGTGEKQDGEGMKTEEESFFLFFLNSMQEHRGLLNIKYPVEVGISSLVLIYITSLALV